MRRTIQSEAALLIVAWVSIGKQISPNDYCRRHTVDLDLAGDDPSSRFPQLKLGPGSIYVVQNNCVIHHPSSYHPSSS